MSVGVYGERLWQCTDCNYSHKKTTNVIDHIEAKHFDERVFCTLCNTSFSTRNYLRKHMKHRHDDSEKQMYHA